MDKKCINCNNAHKRGAYDLNRYGWYDCGYECCIAKHTTYKRFDDCCEKWVEKQENRKGGN